MASSTYRAPPTSTVAWESTELKEKEDAFSQTVKRFALDILKENPQIKYAQFSINLKYRFMNHLEENNIRNLSTKHFSTYIEKGLENHPHHLTIQMSLSSSKLIDKSSKSPSFFSRIFCCGSNS